MSSYKEIRELALLNERFHDKKKGCRLVSHSFLSKEKQRSGENRLESGLIDGKVCTTHEVSLCRCGWEWGWHGGAESSKLEGSDTRRTKNKRRVPEDCQKIAARS